MISEHRNTHCSGFLSCRRDIVIEIEVIINCRLDKFGRGSWSGCGVIGIFGVKISASRTKIVNIVANTKDSNRMPRLTPIIAMSFNGRTFAFISLLTRSLGIKQIIEELPEKRNLFG